MRKIGAALLAVVMSLVVCSSVQAKSSAARAALDKVLPEAKFISVPMGDCFDFLRDVSGANIVIDWKALESLNISKDEVINLNLHQVRLGKILNSILEEAGPGDTLTYYVDENVIHITSRAVADSKLLTMVYYVDDILEMNTPFDPTINVPGGTFTQGSTGGTGNNQSGGIGSSSGGGGMGGGGGGGGGLFGNSNSGGQGTTGNAATEKQDRAKELITLIQKTVRPEVWKDNGGTSAIEYYNGNIIVTAPRSVQEAIGGPLD